MSSNRATFAEQFALFQGLIAAESQGHPFTNFHEGLAAVWEGYKPRLRDHALKLLASDDWGAEWVGTGAILHNVIAAIEIQGSGDLKNNLVFWQNRFGHANRDHRALLEARTNASLRDELESLLYGLYRGGGDEGVTFDRLSELTGAKYPLIAYLFFLKDMDRFMPIQPTGFDRAFRALGIDFSTLRNCRWANYATFNETLQQLRPLIGEAVEIKNVRLVDAHSFCWIFATLLKREAEGGRGQTTGAKDSGRIVGGREKSIIAMRYSIENTTRNSNGQVVERILKNKELRMSAAELDKHLAELLDLQGNCCALTGIPFDFHSMDRDRNLFPSPDRIDSNGHYEVGNIQVVCQFINFWKGSGDNEEFKRLLMLVRGLEEGPLTASEEFN